MRICRGILKGRILRVPKVEGLRLTETKVREALWSILYKYPKGSFLDLFSGSGIVAFEALSVGFSPVEAVELNKKLCEFIKKNSRDFEITINVYNKDVIDFLKKIKKEYDFVYIDPPYKFPKITTVLTLSFKILSKDGILILENPPNFKYHIEPFKIYRYGKTNLYFFKKEI